MTENNRSAPPARPLPVSGGAGPDRLLEEYGDLLLRANERARLVGPSDLPTLMADHILDCCAALPLLPRRGRVVDVGTGGGLPGLVWALRRPDLDFTLLDSVGKKIDRVAEMAELLGLRNVRPLRARAEEAARAERELFDLATARAVTEAGVLAEYLAPFVRVGGSILIFKGRRVFEELDRIGLPWSRLGLASPELYRYELAPAPSGASGEEGGADGPIPSGEDTSRTRYLLTWRKVSPTPAPYPRPVGEAEKHPWFVARDGTSRRAPSAGKAGQQRGGAPHDRLRQQREDRDRHRQGDGSGR